MKHRENTLLCRSSVKGERAHHLNSATGAGLSAFEKPHLSFHTCCLEWLIRRRLEQTAQDYNPQYQRTALRPAAANARHAVDMPWGKGRCGHLNSNFPRVARCRLCCWTWSSKMQPSSMLSSSLHTHSDGQEHLTFPHDTIPPFVLSEEHCTANDIDTAFAVSHRAFRALLASSPGCENAVCAPCRGHV